MKTNEIKAVPLVICLISVLSMTALSTLTEIMKEWGVLHLSLQGNLWKAEAGQVEKFGRMAIVNPWKNQALYFDLDVMSNGNIDSCSLHFSKDSQRVLVIEIGGNISFVPDEQIIANFARAHLGKGITKRFTACQAVKIALEKADSNISYDKLIPMTDFKQEELGRLFSAMVADYYERQDLLVNVRIEPKFFHLTSFFRQ